MADDAGRKLLNVLVELFGVVLLGALTFHLKLLKSSDIKGIAWFVSRWAFPVTLFGVTSVLNFDAITTSFWMVMLMIFCVKLCLMIPTYCATLLVNNGPDRFLRAASQLTAVGMTNDVAFGIGITLAVFPKQLALMSSICVIVDSTIAIILITAFEFGAMKRESALSENVENEAPMFLEETSAPESCLTDPVVPAATDLRTAPGVRRRPVFIIVVQKLVASPIIRGVVGGLIYRVVLKSTLTPLPNGHFALPEPLQSVVKTVSAPYNTLVMFQIGEFLVNTAGGMLEPRALVLPLVFVVVSEILAPALMYSLVGPFTGETGKTLGELQGFVVMYGLIPSSEVAVVFAHIYNVVDTSTSSLFTITTFLAGPLIFLSVSVIQSQSPTSFESLLYDTKAYADIMSLIFLAVFFATFWLMRRRWFQFPMSSFGIFGILLGIFSIVSLVMHYWSASDCSSKGLYMVRQISRMAIDLFVLKMAISEVGARTCGLARTVCLDLYFTGLAIAVPCVIFISAGVLEDFTVEKGRLSCYEALPIERYIYPAMHSICLVGTMICLLLSMRSPPVALEREILNDVGLQIPVNCGDTVVLLGAIGTATWVLQLIHDITPLESAAARFLAFVSLVLYNCFAIVLCSRCAFRGEPLSRWRSVMRNGCCCRREQPRIDTRTIGPAAKALAGAPNVLSGHDIMQRLKAARVGEDFVDTLDIAQQLLEAAGVRALEYPNEFVDEDSVMYSIDFPRLDDISGGRTVSPMQPMGPTRE
eukprot:TRINITY_DN36232_c0_g1_i1.p1 TRINITY_DN36232_c0_g1~~TRINITY_DN36232_c0_g1_i1.p1  ORF type:complete len:773 (+),score=129.78 TRINITY_DN36232_c0_g1_i1:47-2320(+)